MIPEDFVENVRQQFMDPEAVALDMESEFRQNDSYDSLTGMTIQVMLKDEYGVVISDDEYKKQITVEDLYDFVNLKVKR